MTKHRGYVIYLGCSPKLGLCASAYENGYMRIYISKFYKTAKEALQDAKKYIDSLEDDGA